MGAGFQFSPAGVIPIPAEGAFDATAMHGAAAGVAAPPYDPEAIEEAIPAPRVAQRTVAKSAPILAATPAAPGIAVTPRTVIKAARARLKEIKVELRRHEALKKERAQLERMLTAAGKPTASLTQLNSRRAG